MNRPARGSGGKACVTNAFPFVVPRDGAGVPTHGAEGRKQNGGKPVSQAIAVAVRFCPIVTRFLCSSAQSCEPLT